MGLNSESAAESSYDYRPTYKTPKYNSWSSESSEESVSDYSSTYRTPERKSWSSESSEESAFEYTPDVLHVEAGNVGQKRYNTMESINELIEKLNTPQEEYSTEEDIMDNPEIQAAISRKNEKLEKLRQLSKDAERKRRIQKILDKLAEEEKELDSAIESIEDGGYTR